MFYRTVVFRFPDLAHINLTVNVPCTPLTSDDIIIEHAYRMLTGKLSIVDENVQATILK